MLGQIIVVIVAVVVSVVSLGTLAPVMTPIAAGAISGVAASVASQVVGMALGIQEKFSWNAVAMAGISGAVGGALGGSDTWMQAAVKGAAGSAISQGIGVATGLQRNFNWAGVAAAGVGSGIGFAAGQAVNGGVKLAPLSGQGAVFTGANIARHAFANAADGIANAATRSIWDGTDFGDNLMAALPDVIGNTIGGAIAGEIGARVTASKDAARLTQTFADLQGGRTAELDEFERQAPSKIQKIRNMSDGEKASALMRDLLQDGLSNITSSDGIAKLNAMRTLAPNSASYLFGDTPSYEATNSVSPEGYNTFVVNGDWTDPVGAAFGLFDLPALFVGEASATLGKNYQDFVDAHPGAQTINTLVGAAAIIAGGPAQLAKNMFLGEAEEQAQKIAEQRFSRVGYFDDTSNYGGSGTVTLATLLFGSVVIGSRHGSERVRISTEGKFEIVDWKGYPDDIAPKPQGPFQVLTGKIYSDALELKNAENKKYKRLHGIKEPYDVHEIHPVKFGGDPVDPNNKIVLLKSDHKKLSSFWRSMQWHAEWK